MRKKSFRIGPALIGSIALHVAVITLMVVEFPNQTRLVLSAIPVQIVSDQQHEAAPAPPEPQAQPQPTPQPPQPQPQPQPPQPQPAKPKPEPPKPVPPKPQPSPRPQPQKPEPRRQTQDNDPADWTKGLAGPTSPTQAQTRRQYARARPGQGADQVSTGPDVDALRGMFGRVWAPNCPAPGADGVQIGVRIHIRFDGTTSGPAEIDNPRPNDPVWVAAARRAAMAAKAVRYRDLPPQQLRMLADRGVVYFKIDQATACRL